MNFDEHDVEAPDEDSPSPQKPRYRECLKNHAVSLGAHAVDGCGEFMPAGDDGTLDALRCAACSCHRNFHRKDTSGGIGGAGCTPYYRAPVGYLLHHQQVQPHQQRPLALPSTSGAHSDELSEPMEPTADQGIGGGSRKRFRTKFTADQKEKMLQFADRVGWRIQKHNEELVQQLCDETGVKRHVLKVWMHNNKNTLGKKP